MTERPSAIVDATRCAALALAVAVTAAAHGQVPDRPRGIVMPRMRAPQASPAPPAEAPALTAFAQDGSTVPFAGKDAPPDPGSVRAAFAVDARETGSRDAGRMVLVLTDGQRLVGSPATVAEGTAWVSPWSAPRPMALEGVRAVILAGNREPTATDEDVIELRNGDRVTGVVTAVTVAAVQVERSVDGARTTVDLPLTDVAAIGLVGPAAARSGMRAWIADGTVVDAPRFEWMGVDHLVAPGVRGARTPSLTVPRRLVVAVQSSPDAVRPLASLAVDAVPAPAAPGARESIARPTVAPGTWPLGAAPIEIEGPAVFRFGSLDGPATFRATVRRPSVAMAAGSPDFVIRSAGREVLRERLGPRRPVTEVSVELGAGPFEIELSSADGSLPGNFAVLERAVLLPGAGAGISAGPGMGPTPGSDVQPAPSQRQ